jgi:hypothetical protein
VPISSAPARTKPTRTTLARTRLARSKPVLNKAARSAVTAVAALGLLAGLDACTRATHPSASAGSVTVTTTGASAVTSAPSAAPSVTASSSTAPSTTAASATVTTTAAPTVTGAPPGPPACTAPALGVTVQRGSGAAGQQFATIQFLNKSSAICSLTGYPGVVLLANGARLGQPATRTGKPVTRLDLGPGTVATAQLTNVSTCNGLNSDSVQVIPPNLSTTVVLPLRFRGCNALSVDPVVRG